MWLSEYPTIYCKCKSGWEDIITDAIEQLNSEEKKSRCGVWIMEIKEKYGGLQFNINRTNETMEEILDDAMKKASHTCETCGKEGRRICTRKWWRVRCEECIKKEDLVDD